MCEEVIPLPDEEQKVSMFKVEQGSIEREVVSAPRVDMASVVAEAMKKLLNKGGYLF